MLQNSKVAHLNKHITFEKVKNKGVKIPVIKSSPQKDWLTWNIMYWCNLKALTLKEEHQFHPDRKWRFDFVIESLMVAIEYNGIFSNKSRHTTVTGYSADMEKINAAQQLGYTVLQYTPLNYKNVLRDLENLYEKVVNKRTF